MNEQSEKQEAADREVIRRIQEETVKLGPENVDLGMVAESVAGSVGEITNADEETQQRVKEFLVDM